MKQLGNSKCWNILTFVLCDTAHYTLHIQSTHCHIIAVLLLLLCQEIHYYSGYQSKISWDDSETMRIKKIDFICRCMYMMMYTCIKLYSIKLVTVKKRNILSYRITLSEPGQLFCIFRKLLFFCIFRKLQKLSLQLLIAKIKESTFAYLSHSKCFVGLKSSFSK